MKELKKINVKYLLLLVILIVFIIFAVAILIYRAHQADLYFEEFGDGIGYAISTRNN